MQDLASVVMTTTCTECGVEIPEVGSTCIPCTIDIREENAYELLTEIHKEIKFQEESIA
jgi:hypothetical protein